MAKPTDKQKATIYDMEIGNAVIRMRTIIKSEFLEKSANIYTLCYDGLLIESIIHLKFLLLEAKDLGIPVSFSDDIPEHIDSRDGYNEITGLIKFFRDAVCHQTAYNKKITADGKFGRSFTIHYGLVPNVNLGLPHMCKYEDDIALLMGDHILYVKRHLVRAYKEVSAKILMLDRFAHYNKLIQLKEQDCR